jgi:hypothetical protein
MRTSVKGNPKTKKRESDRDLVHRIEQNPFTLNPFHLSFKVIPGVTVLVSACVRLFFPHKLRRTKFATGGLVANVPTTGQTKPLFYRVKKLLFYPVGKLFALTD